MSSLCQFQLIGIYSRQGSIPLYRRRSMVVRTLFGNRAFEFRGCHTIPCSCAAADRRTFNFEDGSRRGDSKLNFPAETDHVRRLDRLLPAVAERAKFEWVHASHVQE